MWALRSFFIFTWFSINTVFHLEQHCFPYRTYSFRCSFHVSNLILTSQTDLVESSTQSSIVKHNSFSIDYPVSCQKLLHPSVALIPVLSWKNDWVSSIVMMIFMDASISNVKNCADIFNITGHGYVYIFLSIFPCWRYSILWNFTQTVYFYSI